jgi:hypothetical protein
MYNLLVHGAAGTWNQTSAVLDSTRFLEFSSDPVVQEFKKLDASVIAKLTSLPTLFVYEANIEEPARVGRIKTVQRRQGEIRITFEFSASITPIGKDKLRELEWDLDFGKLEMNRTHWAVKDVDLLAVLGAAGLVGGGSASMRPARRQILGAADRLSNLGHSGFDRMLLEFGVDDLEAGRDLGGLGSRANALAKFAIENPTAQTVEGIPVGTAVIDYARRLGWDDEGDTPTQHEGIQAARAVEPERIVESSKESGLGMPTAGHLENTTGAAAVSNKVFLVHGRDSGAMHEVARFLEKIGLDVTILHERPNRGRTLISKFQEESADISFAVVLMTPDDSGSFKGEKLSDRARQNVVFELGFFIGRLGAENVCALVSRGVERPSDFESVVYIEFEGNGWKTELARELRAAGISFDYSKVF